jgi:hypothetical protein
VTVTAGLPPSEDVPVTVLTITGPVDTAALSNLLNPPTEAPPAPAATQPAPAPAADTPAPAPTTDGGDLGPAGPDPTTAPAPQETTPEDLGPAGQPETTPEPAEQTPAPALQTPESGGGVASPALALVLVGLGAAMAL